LVPRLDRAAGPVPRSESHEAAAPAPIKAAHGLPATRGRPLSRGHALLLFARRRGTNAPGQTPGVFFFFLGQPLRQLPFPTHRAWTATATAETVTIGERHTHTHTRFFDLAGTSGSWRSAHTIASPTGVHPAAHPPAHAGLHAFGGFVTRPRHARGRARANAGHCAAWADTP